MSPRTKRTARKCTPGLIPVLTPTVYLNPDGTIKKDPKKDREQQLSAIRSKMAKAIKIMNEAKEMLFNLDENSDVEEIFRIDN